MRTKTILLVASASAFLGSTLTGATVPNDPSVNGNLILWLEDAASNYSSGTWTDSSSAGNDVSDVTSPLGGSFSGGSSLNASVTYNGFTRSAVSIADDGIMGASGVNGGSGFSSLTIFSLYQVSVPGSETRALGIGSKTMEGVGDNFDRLNLASDPTNTSLRFDDGFTAGTATHGTSYVLRATKLDAGKVWDAFYDLNTGTLVYSINNLDVGSGSDKGTSGASFVTKNDDFYMGDIAANPGVTNPSSSTYNLIEVVMYDSALTGSQMEDIADYLAVPEPSTYALIGGFLALGAVMVRRRMRR